MSITHNSSIPGRPPRLGLYHPDFEHDACGIGFVADIKQGASHEMLDRAVDILDHLKHRGAVGGDTATGDGAGLMMQIPDAFFRSTLGAEMTLPPEGHYAVGMVFLPQDAEQRRRCRQRCEEAVTAQGGVILGWRPVPVQSACLGELARSTEPVIEQLFIGRGEIPALRLESRLLVMRRWMEKEIRAEEDPQGYFYVASLSSHKIVYKGLMTGDQIATYYPDLKQPECASAYVMVHQRYSTNTWPTWPLAQPFRFLAHNGEINTLRANINRMKSREPLMQSDVFDTDMETLRPIIQEGTSDSSVFDNVLELLVLSGRSLPHAMMMMIPEAHGPRIPMSADKRAFYEYHSALMEPWDGPAAVTFCDGRYIGATLDRNGLRPARYTLTRDGLIVLASESGVLDIPADRILRRGRLQPGKMFLVDLVQRRVVPDQEIKSRIARQRPYRRWIRENRIELRGLFAPSKNPACDESVLIRLQHVFGYTREEIRMLITPMASHGQEPVGSMGNDAALAVLSDRPQLLFSYFKQRFAQVTNPPIDPLREELVMSLESFVGTEQNILREDPEYYRGLKLSHPILTPADMGRIREADHPEIITRDIDMLFAVEENGRSIKDDLHRLFEQAEAAIDEGVTMVILSDQNLNRNQAPLPVLLAASGLHQHLIRRGKRNRAGIIVETGEAREVIHFALLIAYGVDAISPYLAFHTIHHLAETGMLAHQNSPHVAMDAYITAIKKGVLKTMSRMGISTLHGFFGSQIFEAVGVNEEVVETYFTGTPSRIGGIGLEEMARDVSRRHLNGFPDMGSPDPLLEAGGVYHIRRGGEHHMWTTEAIHQLQTATRRQDYAQFKSFTAHMNEHSTSQATLRGLMRIRERPSIPLERVEPEEVITCRFVTAAMSFGSISKEAHEALAIALNRVGGRSNSGEGGEDPVRYQSLPNGDSKRSRIKQIASGRFGVTTEYLMNADEVQIKMAQGAKPGEGGQLPGHKVTAEIARVRYTTPGVTLISPPPHHDIYSIEDLAQLIYDLKQVNPRVNVSVKLVSEVGVGTIAAGVAKANADLVLISGHDGGTGAAPLTSIKYAGLPWELGLAETQQTLIANQLRSRIRVQVDGQLKTGRDLIVGALLGAEEFGFGTAALVTLGCVMMRKCHLNTCPVGVATQDERLRRRFSGTPEYVECYLRFLAREVREWLAVLGFERLDDLIGRTDLLDMSPAISEWKDRHLDLHRILDVPVPDESRYRHQTTEAVGHDVDALDHHLIERSAAALNTGLRTEIQIPIRNVHRTVGATLSGQWIERHGANGLPEDTLTVRFTGSAGQSFGAFLARGMTFRLSGDANDTVGKGLTGGKLIVVPPENARFDPQDNVIIGNVALYGATSGELYVNGLAGERFAVRNSGARAVVEGVGDHGCEYMTGGVVVVLGPTGNNFAAGMSGGIAYVFDETELFDTRCNLDMVDLELVWNAEDQKELRTLLQTHWELTHSPRARMILDRWEELLPLFVKVMPIDYRRSLERMRLEAEADLETVAATEEVYHG